MTLGLLAKNDFPKKWGLEYVQKRGNEAAGREKPKEPQQSMRSVESSDL